MPGLLEIATSYFERYARDDLASVVLETILDIEPQNPAALTLSGRIAARGGMGDAAAALYRMAISLSPSDSEPRRQLAALQISQGALRASLSTLELATECSPGNAAVHFDLGSVFVHLGEPDRAAEEFHLALACDPEYDSAVRALVVLEMTSHRLVSAAERYRGLLKLELGSDAAAGRLVAAGWVCGFADWCAGHGAPYAVTSSASTEALHPPRFVGETGPDVIAATKPETYVAEVPDATVIGEESLVLAGSGEVVWDLAIHDRADRFDLTERVLKFAAGGTALVDAEWQSPAGVEAAVHLLGVSSVNYFHMMIEILPRLANLEAASDGTDYASLPLLVDAASLAIPQHLDALRAIVGPNRRIIPVERETAVHVDRLVVPSQLAWMSNNLKDGLEIEAEDVLISEAAVRFLRERLTPPDLRLRRRGSRRIHLVKPGSKRLMNAAELVPVLDKYSLEPVAPESLSIEEQIRLFADVDVLVCETGAGLTNLVFAPEAARVVVMTGSATWRPTWFSQIAGIRGQSMTYVAGTVTAASQKSYQSCFVIDPSTLDAVLAEVLGEPAGMGR